MVCRLLKTCCDAHPAVCAFFRTFVNSFLDRKHKPKSYNERRNYEKHQLQC